MIEVKEVKTKKQQKEFLDFPLKLYRGNDCFVPPLYADEKKIFDKDYLYLDTCEAVYFLCYRDGAVAGRISGILQKASNEKRAERRIRFTRFDCVEDFEVARALFCALEAWGRSIGMDTVCGPLGFSDLEREGLLIEGFDQLSTFEEQYNAPYYADFIERLGYKKEADWTESRLTVPEGYDGELDRLADFVMKRYHLHYGEAKNTRDFIRRYGDRFFDFLDQSYEGLYGTVPFTPGMRKMMLDNFKLIIKLKYVAVILDEHDELVCLGICFPSLARALQKSEGHLTPAAIVRVLRDIRRPKILDLGLVGVRPDMENRGISTAVCAGLMKMLQYDGIEYAETNLNLEENHAIQNQWKRFSEVKHKRRRSYVKSLGEELA